MVRRTSVAAMTFTICTFMAMSIGQAQIKVGMVKLYPPGVQLGYTCLQGIVNRSGLKIYLDDNDGVVTQEHRDLDWYQTIVGGNYGATLSDNFAAVCLEYQQYIAGYTIFDPNTSWEVNAATTLAGAIDYVPVTPEWVVFLQDAGLMNAQNTLDIRGQWNSAQECYDHMYNFHWLQSTAPFVAVQDPSNMNGRDYYVYARAFVFYFDNLNNTHPVSSTFIDKCYSQKSYVMGWALPEGTEVQGTPGNINYVSRNDAWMLPASPWGPRNLSLLSQYSTQAPKQSQGNAIVAGNKYYVAFMISDGDNASLIYTHYKARWEDPARGQVPLGWGISPWFSKHVAPAFMNWFMSAKSNNDYFVGSVSGTGYNYLMELSPSFRANYLAQTASDMSAYGIEVGWVLNDSENPISQQVLGEYIDATGVKGLFVDFSGNGNFYVWHDAMVINSINTYTNDKNAVLSTIQSRASQLTKPGFIMVTCNGWGMTPTKIKWVADNLGAEYEVLRPDVFVKTYLKIYGYPY